MGNPEKTPETFGDIEDSNEQAKQYAELAGVPVEGVEADAETAEAMARASHQERSEAAMSRGLRQAIDKYLPKIEEALRSSGKGDIAELRKKLSDKIIEISHFYRAGETGPEGSGEYFSQQAPLVPSEGWTEREAKIFREPPSFENRYQQAGLAGEEFEKSREQQAEALERWAKVIHRNPEAARKENLQPEECVKLEDRVQWLRQLSEEARSWDPELLKENEPLDYKRLIEIQNKISSMRPPMIGEIFGRGMAEVTAEETATLHDIREFIEQFPGYASTRLAQEADEAEAPLNRLLGENEDTAKAV